MDISFPELAKATVSMYSRCAKEATQTLIKDWLLVVGSVVLFLGFSVAGALLAPLGLVGGMLIGLVGLAALTYYYAWLTELTRSPGGQRRARLDKATLLEFDVNLFFVLISASFVLWVVDWIVGSLILGMNAGWVKVMLSVALIFLFNSLPETLYVHRSQSLSAFQDSFQFTLANWIEWYLPFLVLTSPFLLLGIEQFPLFFAMNSPLLPVAMVFQVPQLVFPSGLGVIAALMGVILANWFMLFRGFLFQELERGTRRQRIFAARQK
jgi:hypothetical protein